MTGPIQDERNSEVDELDEADLRANAGADRPDELAVCLRGIFHAPALF